MILPGRVKEIASRLKPEIISIRHYLHSHPELSFQEKDTAQFISSKLTEWNIPHKTEIAGTGITGIIQSSNRSSKNKKVIALRADMDALPITEQNDVSYKSQQQGVMHACGHDVHSASLLGAIKILNELKDELEGTVKFIFQPGEEKLPGGASLLIKEGVLQNPKPDVIIAQHVFNPLPVGSAGFFAGKYMASADEIYITVKGKGGHAADPDKGINPLFIAGALLMELQKFADELSEVKTRTVLNFGRIVGAGATNVIPDEVTIDGTLRTMDEDWRNSIHKKLEKLVKDFSGRNRGETVIRIDKGYPCLMNDTTVTNRSKAFAVEYLGEQKVHDLEIRMASEDFAFYSQLIPACFYRIGTGNPAKNITASVHTSTFNIDEDALEYSTGLMAWLALRNLLA